MSKRQYFIEVTDTYGGESNYSWVRRYQVTASTVRGAVWKLSRHEGYSFRADWDSGDTAAYKAQGACIIAFVSLYGDEPLDSYSRMETL